MYIYMHVTMIMIDWVYIQIVMKATFTWKEIYEGILNTKSHYVCIKI